MTPAGPHQPLISVVVPTHRRSASLRRLVQALERQTLAATSFELIVALDGAQAGIARWLVDAGTPFRLSVLQLPHRGRAAARNAAIRTAAGDLVVMLDDDMEPLPGCLAAHAAAHAAAAAAGERRAIVGAAPVSAERGSGVSRYVAGRFARHMDRLAEPGHAMTYREFYSGNVSVERCVLEEVGLFDEAYVRYGNEDGELALRLQDHGVRLVYDARAAATQRYHKTFGELAADTISKGHTAVQLARMRPADAGQLRLARGSDAPGWWRLARSVAVGMMRRAPFATPMVVAGVTAWERLHGPRLFGLYDRALDACYWLGVQQALGPDERVADLVGDRAGLRRDTVALVVESSTVGGAEQVALTLGRGLGERGWRVLVAVTLDAGHAAMREVVHDAGLGLLDLRPPRGRALRPLHVASIAIALRHAGVTLVHLNQHEWRSGRHVAVAAALAGIPVIATVHLLPSTPLERDWRQRLFDRMVRRYISVSPAIAERLVEELKIAPARVTTVLNGIDPAPFPDRVALRPGSDGLLQLLAVGRLTGQKGLDDAIRLAARHEGVSLTVAGDGPLREELEGLATELGVERQVSLIGHRNDVPQLLASCDVLLLPSRSEGLPLVILEAMAAGRPVIATALPGLDAAVQHGSTGLLVPLGDENAMDEAVRLLRDRAVRQRMGEAARRLFVDRFSAGRMVAEVEALYRELTDPATTPEKTAADERPSLRLADWRLLLPGGCGPIDTAVIEGPSARVAARLVDEGLVKSVVQLDDAGGAATAGGAASASPRGSGAPGGPSVVVIAAADRDRVDAAARLVAPGGAVWVAVDRRRGGRTPGGVRSQLRRSGLVPIGTYWTKPAHDRVEMAIPLHAPGALGWYLRAQLMPTTALRLVIRSLALLGMRWQGGPGILERLVPAVAVLAIRPGGGPTPGPGPTAITGPDGPLGRQLTPLLIAPGDDEHNRVVLALFDRGGGDPVAVAKIPRTASRDRHTAHEHDVLVDLAQRLRPPMRSTVPAPIALVQCGAVRVGVESAGGGRLLAAVNGAWPSSTSARKENLGLVATWLGELHQATAVPGRWGDIAAEHVHPVLDRYGSRFGLTEAEKRLFEGLRARIDAAADAPAMTVLEHDGLADWNIYRRSDRSLFVVDWEGGAHGLPLLDLAFYAWHWYLGTAAPSSALERFRRLASAEANDGGGGEERAIVEAELEYRRRIQLAQPIADVLRPFTLVRRAVYHASRHETHDQAKARSVNRWVPYVGVLADLAAEASR